MRKFVKRTTWSGLDKVFLAFAVIGAIITLFGDGAGRVEGRIWPVVTGYQAHPVPSRDGFGVLVSGQFMLERGECRFRRVEWFVRGERDTAPVGIQFGRGVVLEPGLNTFSGLRINIGLDQLDGLVGIATYQCPWRPWRTRTQFYP